MNKKLLEKNALRTKRALRVRKRIRGTSSRPRLTVVKTNKHLYAQLIDDEQGKTLGSVGTHSKASKASGLKKNKESARKLGQDIAKIALDQQVAEVIYDRGCFKYHGILAELADAARESGLKF